MRDSRNLDAGERDDSAPSADVDETLEDTDESGGSVGADAQLEGGSVDTDDQLDGSDDDADLDAHPRHPERDGRGRFNGRRPGPGRPRGCSNYRTLRALELRQRIIASWDRVDADKLLDRLARTNFAEYLRLVIRLLPPERREPVVEQRQLVLNIQPLGYLPPRREPGELRALPPVDAAGE